MDRFEQDGQARPTGFKKRLVGQAASGILSRRQKSAKRYPTKKSGMTRRMGGSEADLFTNTDKTHVSFVRVFDQQTGSEGSGVGQLNKQIQHRKRARIQENN